MKICEIISEIRAHKNLTQAELAAKINVSFATINRWENNKSIPRLKYIKKIESLHKKISNKKSTVSEVKRTRRPVAYCFFAGAGGMHLGLENSGINVVLSTDIEEVTKQTHKINWPNCPFLLEDIRKVSAEKLLELAKGRRPDIIAGGPPCQGFSTLGDKLSGDPRNELFEQYARLVEKLSPKVVLIENVKALTTMYGGRYLENIIHRFAGMGYLIFKKVLNAADYGVPQLRERVFIVGTKLEKPFAFPRATHGKDKNLLPYVNTGKAIMDLVGKENKINAHIPLSHSERVVSRYKFIPEGGKLPPPEELPKEIRRKNFGNTYKRLHRKQPSLTMVPGNNAFPIHPVLNRSLTPREAARLQTFPDDFQFTGDRRRQCILVGNAVPPLLSQKLGKMILKHIRNEIPKSAGDQVVETVVCNSEKNSKLESVLRIKLLKNKTNSKGFIDLFSGAGGFTIGLSKAGMKPIISADNNRDVASTHNKNYPTIPFIEGDLSENKTMKILLDNLGDTEVGVISGGPPCQGFSIFGKRRFVNSKKYNPHSDERNKLVYSFVDVVEKINPRWFIMENVPGLANLDNGMFLESLLDEFVSMGYSNTQARILNCAAYGVPQLRRRLVIIGNRTGHIVPWPKEKYFEEPEDWQDSYRTVGEVITDLSDDQSHLNKTCHVAMNHKPLLVERYKYIEEGKKLNVDKLPKKLKKGYRTEKVKNYSHIFKRLHRNKPATTMVPGHNAFPIHPWLNRALTVREAARIQTFPDEIEFMGSRQNQCIQVGNAFPPLLAEIIGNNIMKAETNNWYVGRVPPSAYYALVEENVTDLLGGSVPNDKARKSI